MIRVGIDTGGTFTDAVSIRDGRLVVRKLPSAPRDPSRPVLEALAALREPGEATDLVHGSTVATNALLERKGARIAFVATRGFGDLLFLGRQDRPCIYDLFPSLPPPLVEPEACFEVTERTLACGTILVPLDEEEVRAAGRMLVERETEAVALCFLHAYANPTNERRAATILRELGLLVSASWEVLPVFREFERAATTAINAYVAPVMSRYTERIEREMGPGRLLIMQSEGGVISAGEAGREAVRTVLSGPAGGVVGALDVARRAGYERIITFDMGGTSTDVALVPGKIPHTTESTIGGLPIAMAVTDIHTVGAGGGSMAWIDAGGVLRVGPQSAGALPGPICYGGGGDGVTVTDANLVLGRISPDHFLGGRMRLDADAAQRGVLALASRLSRSAQETAEAVLAIANEHMVRAIRVISVERGIDPRSFTLVSFGGAGGLHACDLASAVGIDRVLVPEHAGVLSAYGMLVANPGKEVQRTILARAPLAPESLRAHVRELEESALRSLLAGTEEPHTYLAPPRACSPPGEHAESPATSGCSTGSRDLHMSMRYEGQGFELSVPFADPAADLVAAFHALHQERYGVFYPERPVVAVTLRVQVELPREALKAAPLPVKRDSRTIEGGVRDRASLEPGTRVIGPAVIPDAGSTTYVPEGFSARMDAWRNLLIERQAGGTAIGDRGLDPLRLEVERHRLEAIAEEMGSTLGRTGYSPNIKERRDYSCAIFDASGNLVAQAAHIPVHLGAMPLGVSQAIRERPMGPGDVVWFNDPYRGGTHLPDITLVAPVFAGGTLAFHVANRAHHADVGALAPGGLGLARSIEEEGVVIPPSTLVRGGILVEAELDAFLARARGEGERRGDISAQLAALRTGERRLRELVLERGLEALREGIDALSAHAEAMFRRLLLRIPEGKFDFEDVLDDDGFGTRDIPIRARIERQGDRLCIDLTASAGEVRGPVNAPRAVAISACLYALRALISEDIPTNAGFFRATQVETQPGTVVDARPPSPVAGGNVETSQRIVDCVLGALSSALPDAVPAASCGSMNNLTIGGTLETGEAWAYYETTAGGHGGHPRGPGTSARHTHMTNTLNTPVEALEHAYPLRVTRYAVRRGSGGRGAHPGGDGVIREIEILAPATVSLLTERRTRGAYGLRGGAPGQPGRNVRVHPDGIEEALPAKITYEAGAFERVRQETPGGGGWGSTE